MPFPDLTDQTIEGVKPDAYARQMGRSIAHLLRSFAPTARDIESNQAVTDLADHPLAWGVGRIVFAELRRRSTDPSAPPDRVRAAQHELEECCAQALYNATQPSDPFDLSASYYVVPLALAYASALELPAADVLSTVAASLRVPEPREPLPERTFGQKMKRTLLG